MRSREIQNSKFCQWALRPTISGKENFGLNISILAAAQGGMYCGSCMRNNALASALKRRGMR